MIVPARAGGCPLNSDRTACPARSPALALMAFVGLVWAVGLLPSPQVPIGSLAAAEFDSPERFDPAAQCRNMLQAADRDLKAGRYRLAWSVAASLLNARGQGMDGIRTSAQALIDRLEQRAEALFEEGEKYWWYREFEQAEPQYRLLFQEFPHSRFFVRARNRLIALRFMPAVASKKLLHVAQEKEIAEQYAEAAKRYLEVMAQYPDTVAAVKAQKALEFLQTDAEKRRKIGAETITFLARELDAKWRLASNYLATVPKDDSDWLLYDRGVNYLHEIIALAPDSPQAAQARQKLQEEQARIEAEEKARAAVRETERQAKVAAEEADRNRKQ